MKNRININLIFLLLLTCSSLSFAQNSACRALIETIEEGRANQALRMLKTVDANCEAEHDGTPLIAASRTDNIQLLRTLINIFDADVNKGILGDGNPLIQASRRGHIQIARYLIHKGADTNVLVQEDETPLINASARGHLNIVKLLISKGADVNKSAWSNSPSRKKELRTPLLMAKRYRHRKIVEYLRKNGAVN